LIPSDRFNIESAAKAPLAVDMGDGLARQFTLKRNIARGGEEYPELMEITLRDYRIVSVFI
jgi:hypothetical protein